MTYTRVGPFVDNSAPYLQASTLNHFEDGLAAANSGPRFIAADTVGITANGTDVSAAFSALIASITTFTEIRLPSGSVNLGSGTFNIDDNLVSLVGAETVLYGSGTITITGPDAYYSRQNHWGAVTRGITFQGMNVNLGDSMYRLVDGGAINCNIYSDSYKVTFDHFHIQGGTFTVSHGPSNAAESPLFVGCFLSDGLVVTLNDQGDWHIVGCSLDNIRLNVTTANVYINNSHFEMTADLGGYRALTVGATGSVTLTDCQWVIDPGSTNWTMAPIYVDPANTFGGLIVRNMQVPVGAHIQPVLTDQVPVFVGGGGRATFDGITTYGNGFGATYALAQNATSVSNGGAEGGTVGWSSVGSITYSIDFTAGNHNAGNASHKIVVGSGQNGSFYQDIPVTPGKLLFVQLWRKYVIGSGASINLSYDFYDRVGNKLDSRQFDQYTANLAAAWKGSIDVIPPGAGTCRINFFLSGGTGGATAYIDDVIANVA